MNEIIIEKLYKLSKKALKKNEIAVAAIIVKDNKIISSTINKRQKKHDVTGHAEIIAIRKAERKIRDWRLDGYIMYVTLKPCKMCETIINEARIDKCYYIIDSNQKEQKNNSTAVCHLQTKENDKFKKIFQESFKKMR